MHHNFSTQRRMHKLFTAIFLNHSWIRLFEYRVKQQVPRWIHVFYNSLFQMQMFNACQIVIYTLRLLYVVEIQISGKYKNGVVDK